MSSGHRHTDAAGVSAVVRLIQRQVGLQNFLPRHSIVSRKFLVPYGAGRSMDGAMTYVDENVPLRFKMGIEPDKYVSGHEGFEWWMMTRLDMKYWVGPGARSAHWWATGYEHMLLKLDGWSDDEIAAYEDEWLTYISEDEGQRISVDTVAPDQYTGPYEVGMDSDEGEDSLDAKILPILQAARARMLLTQQARLIA
jgi:hypothetical protein